MPDYRELTGRFAKVVSIELFERCPNGRAGELLSISALGTPPTAFAGFPGPSRQFAVEFSVRR